MTVGLVSTRAPSRHRQAESHRHSTGIKSKAGSDALKRDMMRLLQRCQTEQAAYEERAAAYRRRMTAYNTQVEQWNRRGGASKRRMPNCRRKGGARAKLRQ